MTLASIEAKQVELKRQQMEWKLQFYTQEAAEKDTRVRGQVPTLSRALKDFHHDRITMEEYYALLESADPEQVDAEFWAQFNSQFRTRIDNLVEGAPPLITEDTQYIVVLAAMNEEHLEEMYDALRENHGDPDDFDRRVVVVCYHNYAGERNNLSASVTGSVQAIAEKTNVVVVEESIDPQNHSVSVAKVIGACAALRMKPANLNIPILFTDGDLDKQSPDQLVAQSTGLINISEGRLAVSSDLDYATPIEDEYPALAFYF